jgi:hypothetical protein
MTIQEIAQQYYKQIKDSPNINSAKNVINQINSLTYQSGIKLSNDDKLTIANEIVKLSRVTYERRAVEFASSNDEILKLCTVVREEISKQTPNGDKK